MSSIQGMRLVALLGVVAVVGLVIGSLGTLLLRDTDSSTSQVSSRTGSPRAASDLASLVVTAQREADVRISVDGKTDFEGHLRAGESVSREGPFRIELWTDNAQGVSVTVNGHDLGTFADAVGQPDWNRISWTWWAGWAP